MNMYDGVEGELHAFSTSALGIGEWSASRSGLFNVDIHWIEGWVQPRAGLDTVTEKTIPATSRNRTPVVQSVA
jgi:hypothetical protein